MTKTKTFRWYQNDWDGVDRQIETWIKDNPGIVIQSHSIANGTSERLCMFTQIVYTEPSVEPKPPVQQLNS